MPFSPAGSHQSPSASEPDGCLNCGYDLAGLPDDAVCPECAHPIGLSRRGDLLRYADERWLRTVHRGLRLVERSCSLAIWCVIALVGLALVAMAVSAVVSVPVSVAEPVFVGVVAAFAAGVFVMHSWGCALIGASTGAGGSPIGGWRHAIRWLGPLFWPACAIVALLDDGSPSWVDLIVRGAFHALIFALLVSLLIGCRRLCRRTGSWEEFMRRKFASERVILIVIGAGYLVFGWLIRGTAGPGHGFAAIVMVIGGEVVVGRARGALEAEIAASGDRGATEGGPRASPISGAP